MPDSGSVDLSETVGQEANHAALAKQEVPAADALIEKARTLLLHAHNTHRAAQHIDEPLGIFCDELGDAIGTLAKAIHRIAEE